MKWFRVGLWTQALLYVLAGVNHFAHTGFYVQIMPDHYGHKAGLVELSGLAEIAGGLGLLPASTRRVAALGLIAMLVGYFDVHLFMLRHPERFAEVPVGLLWARLPLQFVLIGWAGWYARKRTTPVPRLLDS